MAGDRNRTILVVDDDNELLELVALVLREDGYQVNTASDGQEGMEKVATNMPDLVLLDMKMPVMDGWEFSRNFHSLYEDGAPIVILTAAADAKKRAEEVSAVDWVGKPFDLDTLLNTVRRHVEGR